MNVVQQFYVTPVASFAGYSIGTAYPVLAVGQNQNGEPVFLTPDDDARLNNFPAEKFKYVYPAISTERVWFPDFPVTTAEVGDYARTGQDVPENGTNSAPEKDILSTEEPETITDEEDEVAQIIEETTEEDPIIEVEEPQAENEPPALPKATPKKRGRPPKAAEKKDGPSLDVVRAEAKKRAAGEKD